MASAGSFIKVPQRQMCVMRHRPRAHLKIIYQQLLEVNMKKPSSRGQRVWIHGPQRRKYK